MRRHPQLAVILLLGAAPLASEQAAQAQLGGQDEANPKEFWATAAVKERTELRFRSLVERAQRDYALTDEQSKLVSAELGTLREKELEYFAHHFEENVRNSTRSRELKGQYANPEWKEVFQKKLAIINGAPLSMDQASTIAERHCTAEQRAKGRETRYGLFGDPMLEYAASFVRKLRLDEAQAATANSIARELIDRRRQLGRNEADYARYVAKRRMLWEELLERLNTLPTRDQFTVSPAGKPPTTRPSDLVPTPLNP